jgi:Kelch motif protein
MSLVEAMMQRGGAGLARADARYSKKVRSLGRNSAQRLPFSFRLSTAEEGAVRGFRIILLILMLAMVAGLGASAWLITSQPQPREAEGWSLGPSLAAPRGELATAIGYARPCPTLPCADSERLFVLGGLSGFFNPESRVEVFDLILNTWSVGPQLPAARHHFAVARLGDESMSVAERTSPEPISVISIGRPKAISGGSAPARTSGKPCRL